MIERYSLPRMKAVWSEDHMFELWLRIEVAAMRSLDQARRDPL